MGNPIYDRAGLSTGKEFPGTRQRERHQVRDQWENIRRRHLDIRYFWIKDITKQMGIEIRHCHTLKMLADFFTKPLHGALFRKFRDFVLGLLKITDLDYMIPSTIPSRKTAGTDEEQTVKKVRWVDDEGFVLVTGKKEQNGHVDMDVARKHLVDKIVSSSFSRNNPASRV
ncbi:hypothetical protein MHU86_3581 [Fragilaria crotonensis]|nr:hypothetical protein MHU86_3581 [Fragilaria crotonensis]